MGSLRIQDDKLLWPSGLGLVPTGSRGGRGETCPALPQPRARFTGCTPHASKPGQGGAAQVDRRPPQ